MKLKPSEVAAELGMYVDTLTAVPNSIPAAMVFLGADLKRILQRIREESRANTKAETRHLRQYLHARPLKNSYLGTFFRKDRASVTLFFVLWEAGMLGNLSRE